MQFRIVIAFLLVIFIYSNGWAETIIETVDFNEIIGNVIQKEGGQEYYKFVISDRNGKILSSSQWKISVPPPRISIVDSNWIVFNAGSRRAPDCYTIFYNIKSNKMSDPIFYVKSFNITSQQVLITIDNTILVKSIFGNTTMKIDIPKDIYSTVNVWDSINDDSFLLDKYLYLSYIVKYDGQITGSKVLRISVL